jgi:hypothetical protein
MTDCVREKVDTLSIKIKDVDLFMLVFLKLYTLLAAFNSTPSHFANFGRGLDRARTPGNTNEGGRIGRITEQVARIQIDDSIGQLGMLNCSVGSHARRKTSRPFRFTEGFFRRDPVRKIESVG